MAGKLYKSDDSETTNLSEHTHDSPEGQKQVQEQIDRVIELLLDMRKDVENLRMITIFASSISKENPDEQHSLVVAAIGSVAAVISDVPEGMAKLGNSLQKLAKMHMTDVAAPTSSDKIH